MDFNYFINKAIDYKKSVASKYLPVGQGEILSKIREADKYLLSIKHDGHFYLLCYENGKVALINHGGNIIKDLPALDDVKDIFEKSKIKSACFPGELYFKKEGQRSRVFDLTANLDEKSENIYFVAFDILSVGETEYQRTELLKKQLKLSEIFSKDSRIHSVGTKTVSSRKEIEDYYKQVVLTDNNEGVIVKSVEGMIYKIKPSVSLDAAIIGYVESEGERSGMIREVLVAMITDDNHYQITAKVGNGFSDDERKKLLKVLEKLKVDSNYIEASGARVAFTMVRPEFIIEYASIDLAIENSKGSINKMCLNYENSLFSANQLRACVSSMSPVFTRLRDDKKVNKDDIRFSQITDIVELIHSEKKLDLKKSTIIKREVFYKEVKSDKMVRKFILWETNKSEDPDYPAYVFHFTDYSPTRKDVLKKDIKVSDSRKQIESIYDKNILENVKKGWKPVK
tara:strand:- start:6073 stop:7437 length:1365 start_codon:yes stop_codon:yes gene_type:complete